MSTSATRLPGAAPTAAETAAKTTFSILTAISVCHFLNDMMQSLIPAIYPILKSTYHLDFAKVGLITLTLQLTASLLQPVIGWYTDRHFTPYSLPIGTAFTLVGLLMLAAAPSFPMILLAVAFVGVGSSVFHPESSRVARMASGGQHGLAQSLFQVGGNVGASLGPLLAGYIVLPAGQRSIGWFSGVALIAILILSRVSAWSKHQGRMLKKARAHAVETAEKISSRRVTIALAVLVALMFSKFVYLASINSYYTFYLIDKFHVSTQNALIHLFIFLGSVAAGTMIGGPVGDRIGRKLVIWCSILGVLPFTLVLPYVNLFWTSVLTVVIGVVLASAFSAIVVYAQELVPGRIGAISGMFFGLAFGMGAIGAAILGRLADSTSIEAVYKMCAFLPALGILTAFLPNVEPPRRRA